MSPIPHLDLLVLGTSLIATIALGAVGAFRLTRLVRAFQSRLDAYAELPILVYVQRATAKIDRALNGLARAPGLVVRAKAALANIGTATAAVRTILTAPTSLWRLGQLLLTGKSSI